MNIEKWIMKNASDLSNKTIAITGSTGGIGKEVCRMLVLLNANLILLDRNESKSKVLKEELLRVNNGVFVESLKVDLENFDSVKDVVEKLANYKIDVLLLNAGAYKIERRKSILGFENVFQINFISQYYIARKVIENSDKNGCGKIILVSSIAHNYSKIDLNDIDFSLRKKASKIYGNSKRFLMFSMYELLKDNSNVKLSVVHPGITLTNITSHYPKWIFKIIKYPMKVIFMNPKVAALSLVKGVFDSCDYHMWIGPKYFNIWGFPKKRKLLTSTFEESELIGKIAEEIYQEISKD